MNILQDETQNAQSSTDGYAAPFWLMSATPGDTVSLTVSSADPPLSDSITITVEPIPGPVLVPGHENAYGRGQFHQFFAAIF